MKLVIKDLYKKFEKNEVLKGIDLLVEKGDTIKLYRPYIVNEYPDMVDEGWTLNDVIVFSEEYKSDFIYLGVMKAPIGRIQNKLFKNCSSVIFKSKGKLSRTSYRWNYMAIK